MKSLIKSVFSTVILATLLLQTQVGFTQSDARMQQNIRISQGIISELLNPETSSQRTFLRTESNANSAYIPGYGVVFELTSNSFPFVVEEIETIDVRGKDDGEDEVIVTVNRSNSDDNADKKENTDLIDDQKSKITDYFLNYANLLGQIKPDERVTVIVRTGGGFQFIAPPPPPSRGQSASISSWRSNPNQSSGFIMSAKRSDISAYKSGSINESQFKSRISTKDIQSESTTELRIFERILETGLSDDANPTFSLGRGITSVYDSESGLLMLGSVRGGSHRAVFFREVEIDSLTEISGFRGVDSLVAPRVVIRGNAVSINRDLDTLTVGLRRANEQLERARVELAKVRELQVHNTGVGFEFFSSDDNQPIRSPKEVQEDLDTFIDTTKDLLLDYGRTLDIVKSGQSIILHLDMRSSGDELPAKLIFSVNKDVIDNFDKRSISKEAAKNQISVVKE